MFRMWCFYEIYFFSKKNQIFMQNEYFQGRQQVKKKSRARCSGTEPQRSATSGVKRRLSDAGEPTVAKPPNDGEQPEDDVFGFGEGCYEVVGGWRAPSDLGAAPPPKLYALCSAGEQPQSTVAPESACPKPPAEDSVSDSSEPPRTPEVAAESRPGSPMLGSAAPPSTPANSPGPQRVVHTSQVKVEATLSSSVPTAREQDSPESPVPETAERRDDSPEQCPDSAAERAAVLADVSAPDGQPQRQVHEEEHGEQNVPLETAAVQVAPPAQLAVPLVGAAPREVFSIYSFREAPATYEEACHAVNTLHALRRYIMVNNVPEAVTPELKAVVPLIDEIKKDLMRVIDVIRRSNMLLSYKPRMFCAPCLHPDTVLLQKIYLLLNYANHCLIRTDCKLRILAEDITSTHAPSFVQLVDEWHKLAEKFYIPANIAASSITSMPGLETSPLWTATEQAFHDAQPKSLFPIHFLSAHETVLADKRRPQPPAQAGELVQLYGSLRLTGHVNAACEYHTTDEEEMPRRSVREDFTFPIYVRSVSLFSIPQKLDDFQSYYCRKNILSNPI